MCRLKDYWSGVVHVHVHEDENGNEDVNWYENVYVYGNEKGNGDVIWTREYLLYDIDIQSVSYLFVFQTQILGLSKTVEI